MSAGNNELEIKKNLINKDNYYIFMDTIKLLGSIAGILSIFIILNAFLYTVKAQVSDYFLANSLILIIGYLAYLTNEIISIKK